MLQGCLEAGRKNRYLGENTWECFGNSIVRIWGRETGNPGGLETAECQPLSGLQ